MKAHIVKASVFARGRWVVAAAFTLCYLLAQPSIVAVAEGSASDARLSRLEIEVVRAEDVRAIKKLQRAYGYYADRGRWDDLADLFTDDAVADYPRGIFDGNASIRAMNTCDEWASIAAAERQVQRATDYDEIEDLQNAYGYYAEKSLWSDIAALFTDDGILEIDDARHAGHGRIRDFPKESGPDGPVKGALNSLLQLQPVIHIAADGRTARIRSRLLQLTRDARGRAMWGCGVERAREGQRDLDVQASPSLRNVQGQLQGWVGDAGRGTAPAVPVHAAVSLPQSR